MEITKTNIDGVLIVTPQTYKDNRGYFMESFNLNEFRTKSGLNEIEFVQDNESFSKYNTLRGLHFQTGDFAQAKLVRVLEGEVYDVAVDLRKDSPTFGQYYGVILDSEKQNQFYVLLQ
jgi:dTDP-4-dehydrorhamnose 3,5-epimerase